MSEDDIVQEPSPLDIIKVEISPGTKEFIEDYEKVQKWVNSKHPNVLWQYDYLSHKTILYFPTKELYVEFCNRHPWVLRGEEE